MLRPPQNVAAPSARKVARAYAILAADALALVVAATCAWAISGLPAEVPLSGTAWNALLTFIAASGAVLLAFLSGNHYTRRVAFWTELRDVVMASVLALLFSGFVPFLLQQEGMRAFPLTAWLVFPAASMLIRTLLRHCLVAAGAWQLRTLVVGHTESATETLAALQSEPQLGYQVVAVINPDKLSVLPSNRRWSLLARHYQADLIVLSHNSSTTFGRDTIEALVRERVPFALMPHLEGLPVLGFEQTRFFSHDTVMFTFRNNLAKPVARFIKIVFDLAAATAGVIVLAPVLAGVALLVKLDGGPALYGHTRIGSGGRPFKCLKFRSMMVDSDTALRAHLAQDPAAAAEWMQTHKLRNDPRISKIGRILRVTSLDELPQLFNVLRLEMSLVGPRPIVGAEVARYGDDIAYYYETRPGLTGLWQVSGRTETSYAKRVQLDTWYVKNWTLWHDLSILAKTIPAVLQRRGAA